MKKITSGYTSMGCSYGNDTISITTSDYSTNTVWIGDPLPQTNDPYHWPQKQTAPYPYEQPWTITPFIPYTPYIQSPDTELVKKIIEQFGLDQEKSEKKSKKKKGEFYMKKRLVRVLVMDSDSRVTDGSSKVFDSGEIVTSLTDEDLFMELNFKEALKVHNEVRGKILDEDRTDKRSKDIFLKPVKMSDLVKRVVILQTF